MLRTNPIIRVVSLLVVAALLTRGRMSDLILTAVLLFAAFLALGPGAWPGLGRLLARVRWLLLSLLLVYGWFTPGQPLLAMAGRLSPSLPGLTEGLARAAILCLMVSAVHLLLRFTSRSDLLAALYQMTWIARPLGLDSRRFAVRVVLALEFVPRVQDLLAGVVAGVRGGGQTLGSAVAEGYRRILEMTEGEVPGPVEFPVIRAVPLTQWLIPAGLLLVYWVAGRLAAQ